MGSEGFFTNVPFYNEQRFHTEGRREKKKPNIALLKMYLLY